MGPSVRPKHNDIRARSKRLLTAKRFITPADCGYLHLQPTLQYSRERTLKGVEVAEIPKPTPPPHSSILTRVIVGGCRGCRDTYTSTRQYSRERSLEAVEVAEMDVVAIEQRPEVGSARRQNPLQLKVVDTGSQRLFVFISRRFLEEDQEEKMRRR